MIEQTSKAKFPSRFGNFTIYAFREGDFEHLALVQGNIENKTVLARVHSKCLTGDTFSSLRCDCREQLEKGLEMIGNADSGIFIYLDQEGRGIGLCNKVEAYALQDQGLDTVDANLSLGFAEDLRHYDVVARILGYLGIEKIRLITNNPDKTREIGDSGIIVEERIPLVIEPTEHNRKYLETKKEKLRHEL
jgi:GTP cyclohydrolase II